MKIYLGYDHAGKILVDAVKTAVAEMGLKIEDLGSQGDQNDDYPDFARAVAEKVVMDPMSRGILICATGAGMAMAANKIHGIRAALANTEEVAHLIRTDNDANILTLGGKIMDEAMAKKVVSIFLTTQFAAGRHERRVNKIAALENI